METKMQTKNGTNGHSLEPVKPVETTALTPFEPRGMEEAMRLADTFAKSALLPGHLRGKPADVLVTLLSGRELGFSPLQSVRAIYVVDGKPTLAAEAMVALCKRHPDVCEWFRVVESTPQRCTYETKRRGEPEPTRLTWTIEDAARAGLAQKGPWKTYPAAMLRARCASALARAVYPELLFGCYDPEELGAPVAAEPGPASIPIRDVTPPPAPAKAPDLGQITSEQAGRAAATVPVEEPVDAEFSPAEPPPPSDADAPADIPGPEGHVARLTTMIESAATLADLATAADVLKGEPKDVRDALRPVYTARHAFLSQKKGGGKS